MVPEDPTSPAADLAEEILDEISSADQDWSLVAARARELRELAERAARRSSEVEPGDD